MHDQLPKRVPVDEKPDPLPLLYVLKFHRKSPRFGSIKGFFPLIGPVAG